MNEGGRGTGIRWLFGALAVVVLATACADDDEPTASSTAPSPTTTTAPVATTRPSATDVPPATPTTGPPVIAEPATTTAPPPVDSSQVVWPVDSAGIRYTDPVAAARGFAVDLVGFQDPVLGEFQAGDSRSGEVEVRRREGPGPVTTVFVRQLSGSDDWWVLGSATANIEIESPAPFEVVGSPITVRGRSTAFEATVNVLLKADGDPQPLVEDFVMGGGSGVLEPFEGTFEFTAPDALAGALILLTYSAEDGTVAEATVQRVRF